MIYPWQIDKWAGFHTGMTDDEIITWLRYCFIRNGAPQRLIDRLYELECRPSEDDIKQQCAEAGTKMCEECIDVVKDEGEKVGLTEQQINYVVTRILDECA
jgi:hypothetical protein